MVQGKTILKALPNVLREVNISGLGQKDHGKVRDFYVVGDKRVLITTDRQSAFNVNLGHIPFKGAVFNLLSKFWFEKTKSIISNHMISVPDPNVMVVRNCQPILVEMIVRGYLTGVTVTSPWGNYQKGERIIYGLKFPDGLVKNQILPRPIITPTTHGGAGTGSHADARLTREEIIKKRLVEEKTYKQMERAVLELFSFGSDWCRKRGLILVDSKYEFGLYKGKLMLMDEIHTPDSSRFWLADTYREKIKKGEEPDNFDKEFLRLWYAKRGYVGDGTPPKMTKELIIDLSQRYISVYEKITGKRFKAYKYPIEGRIKRSLKTLSTHAYKHKKI